MEEAEDEKECARYRQIMQDASYFFFIQQKTRARISVRDERKSKRSQDGGRNEKEKLLINWRQNKTGDQEICCATAEK